MSKTTTAEPPTWPIFKEGDRVRFNGKARAKGPTWFGGLNDGITILTVTKVEDNDMFTARENVEWANIDPDYVILFDPKYNHRQRVTVNNNPIDGRWFEPVPDEAPQQA